MSDDASETVCIYEFREGEGKHSPRPSYTIRVGEEWVPWQSWVPPVLLDNAVIHTGRNGQRWATPDYAGLLDAEVIEEGEVVGGFRETAAGLATSQGVSEQRARAAVSRVVRDLRRRQREERRAERPEAWPPARGTA